MIKTGQGSHPLSFRICEALRRSPRGRRLKALKIRILDRFLVALAGLMLVAGGVALTAQVLFDQDIISFVGRVLAKESLGRKALFVITALFLILLGMYCFLILFRHQKREDKFILQKTENGELAISIKALRSMVDKCLEPHQELEVEDIHLENQREGLLIRIRGNVAGGISIPLTIEALQKQIKQYVTACSGVEVKSIRVQIETSGDDLEDAPFAIAPPTAQPLLREGESHCEESNAAPAASEPEPDGGESAPPPDEISHSAASQSAPVIPVLIDDDDDRPIHQKLFSTQMEPCIVPMPPEGMTEDFRTTELPASEDEASHSDESDETVTPSVEDDPEEMNAETDESSEEFPDDQGDA